MLIIMQWAHKAAAAFVIGQTSDFGVKPFASRNLSAWSAALRCVMWHSDGPPLVLQCFDLSKPLCRGRVCKCRITSYYGGKVTCVLLLAIPLLYGAGTARCYSVAATNTQMNPHLASVYA